MHRCPNCTKTYKSQQGLRIHKCKAAPAAPAPPPPPPPPVPSATASAPAPAPAPAPTTTDISGTRLFYAPRPQDVSNDQPYHIPNEVIGLTQPITLSGVDPVTNQMVSFTRTIDVQFTDVERVEFHYLTQELLRISERRERFTNGIIARNIDQITEKLNDVNVLTDDVSRLVVTLGNATNIKTRLIPPNRV